MYIVNIPEKRLKTNHQTEYNTLFYKNNFIRTRDSCLFKI